MAKPTALPGAYTPPSDPRQRLLLLHRTLFDALTPEENRYAESRANGSPPYVAARAAGVPDKDIQAFLEVADGNPLIAEAIQLYSQLTQRVVEAVTPDRIAKVLARAEAAAGDSQDLVSVANAMIKLLQITTRGEGASQRSRKRATINAVADVSTMSDEELLREAAFDKLDRV